MFWERFYNLCIEKEEKPNPVAKYIGISSSAVTKWKNGTVPNGEVLIKLADYFNCSIDYLLGRTDEKSINTNKTIIYRLPIYKQNVAAGPGQLGFDQKHTMKDFQLDGLLINDISYGVTIKGTSMQTSNSKSIPNGSTVLVTTNFDPSDLEGSAVIVNINGDLVCKEYVIADDGHLWLKSRNESEKREDRHIYNVDNIKVIGKVLGYVKGNRFIYVE